MRHPMEFVAGRRHYRALRRKGPAGLEGIAALNRINALACIRSAGRGWVGACYSAAEVLTVLYYGLGERDVILSKGHAAPLQYACLAGLGVIPAAALRSYKDGPAALQAHTDIGTPGILVNTGSLGQALSKAAGLAWARPGRRHFVVLGDGELQEGQNFEAFQTVCHRGLRNLTVILDLNGFQSELRVGTVKRIRDYRRMLEGFGFSVLEADGHDVRSLLAALRRRCARPKFIIARTRKGGGSRFLRPDGDRHPWHSGVPGAELARKILREQTAKAGLPGLLEELARHEAAGTVPLPAALGAHGAPSASIYAPQPASRPTGTTRDWFSDELRSLARHDPRIVLLDADLAGSCGLGGLRDGKRFLEMGIGEQDMVSFAGGLALAGRVPVVHTYAAFFKRAFEQVCVNQSEGRKVIYAGHYAGLCYHTDGKSHQSLNDLALMRSAPGLVVAEPVDEAQTRALLRWAVREAPGSVYFRLRRTPAGISLPGPVDPRRPAVLGKSFRRAFLCSGTVATALALRARGRREFRDFGLIVRPVFGHELDLAYWRRLLSGTRELIVVEDGLEPGGLYECSCGLLQKLGLRPRTKGLSVAGLGASFRTLDACLDHFGLTVDGLRRVRSGRLAS